MKLAVLSGNVVRSLAVGVVLQMPRMMTKRTRTKVQVVPVLGAEMLVFLGGAAVLRGVVGRVAAR